MGNRKFIDDSDRTITTEELKDYFYNEMSDEDREEYENSFESYFSCCMLCNGGCLTEYKE